MAAMLIFMTGQLKPQKMPTASSNMSPRNG